MSQGLIITFLVLSVLACNCNDNNSNNNNQNPHTPLKPPAFSADSSYSFIEKQVAFGPRIPNSTQHDSCAEWLTQKLEKYADEVIVQSAQVQAYDGTNLNIKNIIASFNPPSRKRILLCAHWDTRPWADQDTENQDMPITGANDGASGVGILLEIARQLMIKRPDMGVDIILFDAEDYGQPRNSGFPDKDNTYCLGSQYWSNNLHKPNYSAMYGILLDMVGAKNAVFTMEGFSMFYAPAVVRKIWSNASKLGHSNYFRFEKTSSIVDDHLYINKLTGIPSIDIVHYDYTTPSHFGPFWHTHQDDMDIISKATLRAVGETVLSVIYAEGEKNI